MKTLAILSLLSFYLFLKTSDFPSHFPKPVYDFEANPLDDSTIALGRYLFYDPVLSSDSTISCASCHSPYNAFAHTDHALSHGIYDSIGTRNAPALFNLAWNQKFMWDGAVHHIDVQALNPITSKIEMNETLLSVVTKLKKQKRYRKAFENAFHTEEITGARVLKALSQFQLTLVSADSKYDQVMLGKVEFTNQEKTGYRIFQKHCANCHSEPLFTNGSFESNGLSIDLKLLDSGRYNLTRNLRDIQKFKVPSLRNLSYSYPYMHDGRFRKLGEVIAHYTTLSGNEKYLSKNLKNGVQLSENEKVDLIAFLLTLNDKSFVFNKNHNFPNFFFFPAKKQ